MLRWLVNLLALTCVAAGVVWFVTYDNQRAAEQHSAGETARNVRLIEQMIKFRATQAGVELNERGFPTTVAPQWFEQGVPVNTLLPASHPWLEIASEEEADLTQPTVRQAVDVKVAGFWYNPHKGLVRARVPVMLSDSAATEIYNRINGTSIKSIFDGERFAKGRPSHQLPNSRPVADAAQP